MSWPAELQHLSEEDMAEVNRLLMIVFKDDDAAAEIWLKDRSEVFRMTPIEMLKRDELGVVRVISYLRDAAP
jgi:hypothetical protein